MIPKSFPMADILKMEPQSYDERLKSIREPETLMTMQALAELGFVDFQRNLGLCQDLNNKIERILGALS